MSAELAITNYLLIVTGTLFFLPFMTKFSDHPFLNLLLRRACWTISIWLMTLNTPIVAGISIANGLGAETELLKIYLWVFGWGAYIFLMFFLLKTLFDLVTMWREMVKTKRMGG